MTAVPRRLVDPARPARPRSVGPLTIDREELGRLLAEVGERRSGADAATAVPVELAYLPIDLATDLDTPTTFDRVIDGFWFESARLRSSNLWIGTAGDRTPAHFDRSHGLLVQARGVKRLWLRTASSRPRPPLAPPWSAAASNFSTSPRCLEHEAELEVTLQPGDAVYIPPFCWHQAHCLTDAVSINAWWRADTRELVRASTRLYGRDVLRRARARWEATRG